MLGAPLEKKELNTALGVILFYWFWDGEVIDASSAFALSLCRKSGDCDHLTFWILSLQDFRVFLYKKYT